jgi:hypothetical protein
MGIFHSRQALEAERLVKKYKRGWWREPHSQRSPFLTSKASLPLACQNRSDLFELADSLRRRSRTIG